MPTEFSMTIEDYNGERSTISLSLPEITVVNFTGVTQDLDELADAIENVTLGLPRRLGFTRTYDDSDAISTDPVTNVNAQRESKWLVSYRDVKKWLDAAGTIANPAFGKTFTFEIPCADLSLLQPNSDLMDITTSGSDGLALKTAIEANVKSPYNRLAPTLVGDDAYALVLSIRHVGRNT